MTKIIRRTHDIDPKAVEQFAGPHTQRTQLRYLSNRHPPR